MKTRKEVGHGCKENKKSQIFKEIKNLSFLVRYKKAKNLKK